MKQRVRRRPLVAPLGGLLILALLVWVVGETVGTRPLPAGATAPHTRETLAKNRAATARVSVMGATGNGIGVVLDASGDVLAGAWPLGGAQTATLQLASGRTQPARVHGVDARTGLALLEATAPLPTHDALDAVETLRPGQPVLLLGRAGVATAGTLRETRASQPETADVPVLNSTLRACPDDAGGILADAAGRVVGILLARDRCGPAQALPLSAASHLAAEPKAHDRAQRGWIGVGGENTPDGVRLNLVVPGSPAARVGLRVGDRVLNIDGARLLRAEALVPRIAESSPGHDAALTLIRGAHAGRHRHRVRRTRAMKGTRAQAGSASSSSRLPMP